MKAFVSDLILYNCPLPHWYGNFAAAVYSLANRIYGGRSIDTALILDDIRMIRSDGDLPEAMQSIPDGESGDYSIASYPARDLARLLLEVDASTWDDGVDGCCGFTTFSPTDPSVSRQTSSITDFLMALASYGYSNVDVPLVPLLQITTLVDRSLQDVSSCDTGTESLTDAMLTATLCAYYSSFDHRFQAIYFPDVRAKYESQDCAQFFDLSSFIAVKMSDDTELTIDAFWNAVNGTMKFTSEGDDDFTFQGSATMKGYYDLTLTDGVPVWDDSINDFKNKVTGEENKKLHETKVFQFRNYVPLLPQWAQDEYFPEA